MPNFFDRQSAILHGITTRIMGFDAVWIEPAAEQEEGEPPIEPVEPVEHRARVNVREASKEEQIAGVAVMYEHVIMEYYEGSFPGLFQLILDGESPVVTIEGKGTYTVRTINKHYDGRTYRAILTAQ